MDWMTEASKGLAEKAGKAGLTLAEVDAYFMGERGIKNRIMAAHTLRYALNVAKTVRLIMTQRGMGARVVAR